MEIYRSFNYFPEYLYAKISGDFDLQEIKANMELLAQLCTDQQCFRVLVDMMEVPSISPLDRLKTGMHAVAVWKGLRVAVLYPGRKISKIMENYAVNRNINVLVTEHRDEAIRWLLREETIPYHRL